MNVNRKRSDYPSINALSAQLSSYGRADQENDDPVTHKALPKKKPFPQKLKIILQLIPGNDKCPDCLVRNGKRCGPHELENGLPLTWANVEYGSLICEECADYHIQLDTKTSSILSLESSRWSLPQVISVLEGGNSNLMDALNQPEQRLRKFAGSSRSLHSSKEDVLTAAHYHPFEYRYKYDRKAEQYKELLSKKVTMACKAYGGKNFQNQRIRIKDEKGYNEGASLATFLVHKSRKGNLTKDFTSRFMRQPDKHIHALKIPNSDSSNLSSFQHKKSNMTMRPPNDKKLPTKQSRAASDFFRRICSDGIASRRKYDTKHLEKDKQEYHLNGIKENRKITSRQQENYEPVKGILKKPKNGRNEKQSYHYRGGTDYFDEIKQNPNLGRKYDGISSQSKAAVETRRSSIDSMTNPMLLMSDVLPKNNSSMTTRAA